MSGYYDKLNVYKAQFPLGELAANLAANPGVRSKLATFSCCSTLLQSRHVRFV